MTVSTLITHIEIETPYMQYAMWTLNRSIDPRVGHVQNIFSIQSPGLGIIAVTIGMTLNALLVLERPIVCRRLPAKRVNLSPSLRCTQPLVVQRQMATVCMQLQAGLNDIAGRPFNEASQTSFRLTSPRAKGSLLRILGSH